jgi:hypothetical protein
MTRHVPLERVGLPGQHEALERTLAVVSRAFAEREPAPPDHRSRRIFPVLVAAVTAAAAVAIGVSPAGSELARTVRDAIGMRHAAPALTTLPAPGQLLVSSAVGPWIVQPDGAKRLLGPYTDASWSPHALFVAVTRAHELLAVDPKGKIRWTIAHDGTIAAPRWSPDGYRIAYRDNRTLRVVAGDGTGDRALAPAAAVAPAWQPATGDEHRLAFVTPAKTLQLVDTDGKRVVANRRLAAMPIELLWSTDGNRLAALSRRRIDVFNRAGDRLASIALPHSAHAAAFRPRSHEMSVLLDGPTARAVALDVDRRAGRPRELFAGTGRFDSLAWSPNGRWLLLTWPTADQWLFIPITDRPTRAVANLTDQFGPGSSRTRAPTIDGWCCPAP